MKAYLEVSESIKKRINSGIYLQGTKLPGENKIAALYGVSRTTIRNSLDLLQQEGYIHRVKGSGTYVNRRKIVQDRSSFSQLFFDLEKIGLKLTSKIISREIISASDQVAGYMDIPAGEKVYTMTWIRMADGDPIIYETMHIPYEKVKGIEDIDLDEVSLYSILSNRYNIQITHGEESFYPCFLNDVHSRFLKGEIRDLGMSVERVVYQEKDVIEYTSSIVKGDRFIYKTVFKRRD